VNSEKYLTESIEKNTFRMKEESDTLLFTLSDLHIGQGNREYITEIIEFIKSLPNAKVIIGGDLLNNTTKGSKGNVLEEYATGQEQVMLAVQMLKPIRDKIVCIIDSGNHENRTQKECYISLTQMIATMLEIPEKYVSDFAIGYLDIGDNTYIYGNLHKHRKNKDYYAYMNTDILIFEHTHELSYQEYPVLFHNKYTKKSSVRCSYVINNGSTMSFPSYAKRAGYKMQSMGTYVVELIAKERRIIIWRDVDLFTAIENGYKGKV
jgi:hypothetical protein